MVIFWVGREQVYESKANFKVHFEMFLKCLLFLLCKCKSLIDLLKDCSYSCKLEKWMVVKWNSFKKIVKIALESN